MSNVLTQSEIDALLNSLNAGGDSGGSGAEEDEASAVKPYDFRTANKFSKEQIRTLRILFDSFSTVLSTRLTGLLRTMCQVSVASVEERLFGEFNNSIPEPTMIAVISVAPLKGSIVLQMSSSVVYGIISRLFGGKADYAGDIKAFTEIDFAVMRNVIYECLEVFDTAWEKVAVIHAKLDRIETSPQFTQITANNEPAAIITMNIHMDAVEDLMTICMPHFLLQPISKKLTSVAWTIGDHRVQDQEPNPALEAYVLQTEVNLKARLKTERLKMRDLLALQVGDILCTHHRINEFITVDVESIEKFQAVLGVDHGDRVVQIAKINKERKDIE